MRCNIIKLKESYTLIPLILAYLILGIFYPYLKADIVKFILFQLVFMCLPAYVFSKWFISENLTMMQRFIFGYPVSMVLLFILSWIGNMFSIGYLECALCIFAVISVFQMLKDRCGRSQEEKSSSIASYMLIYSICAVIVFRMFILPSSPPAPEYPGLFYQDSLWNLDITWTYIRGFPLEDSKLAGVPFGYHMLKNIYQAVIYKYTKIDPFNIHFAIEPISDWFIMVFLIFWGAIKLAKFTLRKAVIFSTGLFFCNAFLGGGLQLHLFINPLTTYFSIAPLVIFVFCILAYINNQRKIDVIYLTALYIYFTSTKSMPGLIIPIVLFVLFLLNLLRKKVPFTYTQVVLGFNILVSAILLKLTIFQNTIHKLTYDYDTANSLAYRIFKKTAFIKDYADIMYPLYRYFSSFIRNLACYILNWPVLLFCILLFTNKEFRKMMKNEERSLAFVIIFFLVTISMMCLFDFPGIRVYYYWYAQVMFLFFGVFALDFVLGSTSRIFKTFASCLIIISIAFCVRDLRQWINIGWGALPQNKGRIWDERASISYGEWSGMQWLKNNTDNDKIIFSDRRYFSHEILGVDMARFYGYTVLSGRQAFAEGESLEAPAEYKAIAFERWDLINKFLSSGDSLEQTRILKKIIADYFIQSLRFHKHDFSKVESLKLVYENTDIKIYKISR